LLHISVDLTPGGPVITLAGELDVATAPAVKACFEVFDVRYAPRLVVDVARLSFCDCAGLSAFLHAHRRALVGDGWFRLCAANPRLRKMIAITGLASTLRCYPSAADAFADVERSATHQREQERS
jgi:anti-anti-sigma factor